MIRGQQNKIEFVWDKNLITFPLFYPIFSPPGSDSLRSGLKFCWHLFFFFSSGNLRAPSADRRKILHDARSCGQFYNPGPKFWRSLPKKFLGTKNMQNLARFQNVCGVHEIFSDCFMTIFFVESFDERI